MDISLATKSNFIKYLSFWVLIQPIWDALMWILRACSAAIFPTGLDGIRLDFPTFFPTLFGWSNIFPTEPIFLPQLFPFQCNFAGSKNGAQTEFFYSQSSLSSFWSISKTLQLLSLSHVASNCALSVTFFFHQAHAPPPIYKESKVFVLFKCGTNEMVHIRTSFFTYFNN